MDTLGDATTPEPAMTPAPDPVPEWAEHREAPVPVVPIPGLAGEAVLPPEVCVPSPADARHAPDDDELAALLAHTRTVAVVGMSPKPSRTSHGVAAWLLDHAHFQLYFVNPVAVGQTALGQPFYASVADLPVSPDMVDVFRRPEHVPPVVDEAIEVGARTVFLQLGIVNEDAAAKAREAGLAVIQNRCLKVEYRRLRDRIAALRPTT